VVHDPRVVRGSPAGINAELGHACGVEAGGRFGLEFRAAQGLAELGYLRHGEVARGAVAGEALVVIA